jgi:hypothetical protein
VGDGGLLLVRSEDGRIELAMGMSSTINSVGSVFDLIL